MLLLKMKLMSKKSIFITFQNLHYYKLSLEHSEVIQGNSNMLKISVVFVIIVLCSENK